MKLFLYILFIPIISISQNESIKSLFSSKDLKYSADLGIKYYSGNLFLIWFVIGISWNATILPFLF